MASLFLAQQEISGISLVFHGHGLSDFNEGQTQAAWERYVTEHVIGQQIQGNYREIMFVYNVCGVPPRFGTFPVEFPRSERTISQFQGKIIKL